MSAPRSSDERPGKDLSVRRQCACGRGALGVYRPKPVAEADDLAVMRRIDELHLEPFYGSRQNDLRTQQGRPWGQPQAGAAAADAGDGDRGRWFRAPARAKPRPGTRYTPTGCAAAEDLTEPRVGDPTCPSRWRAASSIWWRSLTGPAGRFWHGGCRTPTCELLRGGAGGGAASFRKAADFQYRSGLHFHRRGFHQQACDGRRRDFDGRTGRFMDSHFHPTAGARSSTKKCI